MAIWALQTSNDFTTFHFLTEEDKAFFDDLAKNYFEPAQPVSEKWCTLFMMRGEPMKHPDFFEIEGTDVIAMSENAAGVMKPLLAQTELLPIETDAGKYYALNVLNFVDCLNKEESDYVETKDGKIVSYSSLEFDEKKIGDASIFRLPQLPYQVFAASDIEDRCEEDELRGLLFDPDTNMVWHAD